MPRRIPLFKINPMDRTRLVLVPGGWFYMGSGNEDPEAYDEEKPRHLHFLQPFYLAMACVTVDQFRMFVDKTGYAGGDFPKTGDQIDGGWGKWRNDPPSHPVRYVNWHDANAYADWAGLRLPAEAQWELAARGYGALKYPWGNQWEKGRCTTWEEHKEPEEETTPVTARPRGVSMTGIFQQIGNLNEWCRDAFHEKAYLEYEKGRFAPPETGKWRLLRGSSWNCMEGDTDLRCGYRFTFSKPEERTGQYGFRLAQPL